jgi:hypothetical protein
MTPEQEAAYALNYGVSRGDLKPDAQREYDGQLEIRRSHNRRADSGPDAVFPALGVLVRGEAAEACTAPPGAGPPGDPVRPGPRFGWALAFSFWALTGAACSAFRFVLSTGPLQACGGYGIWLSAAPQELLPAWTGHGLLGPELFPFTRLGLASWLLALIVFPVVGSRLSKAQGPQWRPKAWAGAKIAGMVLAVLAVVSYQVPSAGDWDSMCGGSNPIDHATAPIIGWGEIPVTIGFLVLAAAMWWILTAPKRPAARPVERP